MVFERQETNTLPIYLLDNHSDIKPTSIVTMVMKMLHNVYDMCIHNLAHT